MSDVKIRCELKDYLLSGKLFPETYIKIIWIFTLLSAIMISIKITISENFLISLSSISLGTSAGMLAIVLAGFIIFPTIDSNFSLFIRKYDYHKNTKHLNDLLFPFWFASLLWGILFLISFLTFIWAHSFYDYMLNTSINLNVVTLMIFLNRLIVSLIIFFTLISLYYTIELTGIIYKLAILRADHLVNEYLRDKDNKKNQGENGA